jgi:hypothetical protein
VALPGQKNELVITKAAKTHNEYLQEMSGGISQAVKASP